MNNSQSKEFVLITEIFWRTFWRDIWRSLIVVVENFRLWILLISFFKAHYHQEVGAVIVVEVMMVLHCRYYLQVMYAFSRWPTHTALDLSKLFRTYPKLFLIRLKMSFHYWKCLHLSIQGGVGEIKIGSKWVDISSCWMPPYCLNYSELHKRCHQVNLFPLL